MERYSKVLLAQDSGTQANVAVNLKPNRKILRFINWKFKIYAQWASLNFSNKRCRRNWKNS